jgi:hypothetical protein
MGLSELNASNRIASGTAARHLRALPRTTWISAHDPATPITRPMKRKTDKRRDLQPSYPSRGPPQHSSTIPQRSFPHIYARASRRRMRHSRFPAGFRGR